MSTKKFLMLVGDHAEDYEVMEPFQTLLMVEHSVHAVCPNQGAGNPVWTAVHNFEGDPTYSEKPRYTFTLNAAFSDIPVDTYDAFVIPGGHAPEYTRLNPTVLEMVQHFAKTNKPIASTGHNSRMASPSGLVSEVFASARNQN